MTDIDEDVDYCQTTSFADDTRMLGRVQTIEDCRKIQNDLTKIYSWAQRNNMEFNTSKCELLRYTHAAGETIQKKAEIRVLGIIMSNKADFDTQTPW